MRLKCLLMFISQAFFVILFLPPVSARDCPSRLPSHQFEVTDWFATGLELRSFYFGADVGDAMPSSGTGSGFQNNLMEGLRIGAGFFPLDDLSISLEVEARYRWPGWTGKTIPGFDFRLTQAVLEYDFGPVDVSAGVQILTFGTGAVLDQRFIALSPTLKTKWFNIKLFGGLTQRQMMKSAVNCMWMRYMSDTNGWKYLSQRPFDNLVAGASFSLKLLRPHRLQLLYMYSRPSVNDYRGHSVALSMGGPIVKQYLSYVIEPMALLGGEKPFLAGTVTELRIRAAKGPKAPRFRLGAALAFNASKGKRLAMVYENLSWGTIRRFNLEGGSIFSARAAWPFVEWMKPFVRYFVQTLEFSEKDMQDELDLGVEFRVKELYSLVVAYTGMNMAPPDVDPTHAVYLEARIVLGE